MKALLALSRAIDGLNQRIGKLAGWLVLAAVLVSAGNSVVRKVFDTSSNAFLEAQWYMFATLFLLCGAYTLLKQEHVRIDVIYLRFSRRTQVGIDIFGTVLFLLPMCLLMFYLCWPYFTNAFISSRRASGRSVMMQWKA